MYEIMYDGVVKARFIKSEDAWNEGLNFFSNSDEFVLVGSWVYKSGTVLKAHNHNQVLRQINRTQEVLFVRSGSLEAQIYSEKDELIEKLVLNKGDVLILLSGGHGYEILEDNTSVLEIKNGPYLGAEVDRRRL